jgi:hypothetical protein
MWPRTRASAASNPQGEQAKTVVRLLYNKNVIAVRPAAHGN